MRVLREYGANLHGNDTENWQPLHAAAYGGEVSTTTLLLQWRAAKILNVRQEWARRQNGGNGGGEMETSGAKNAANAAAAPVAAGAAWSLEQETVSVCLFCVPACAARIRAPMYRCARMRACVS
jgi:hypothetical protein